MEKWGNSIDKCFILLTNTIIVCVMVLAILFTVYLIKHLVIDEFFNPIPTEYIQEERTLNEEWQINTI